MEFVNKHTIIQKQTKIVNLKYENVIRICSSQSQIVTEQITHYSLQNVLKGFLNNSNATYKIKIFEKICIFPFGFDNFLVLSTCTQRIAIILKLVQKDFKLASLQTFDLSLNHDLQAQLRILEVQQTVWRKNFGFF